MAQLRAELDIERLRNEKYRAAWYAEQQKLERDLAAAEARVKELEARCESYQGLQFDYEMAKAELTAVQQDAQRLREAVAVEVEKHTNEPHAYGGHCCGGHWQIQSVVEALVEADYLATKEEK